MNTKQFDLLEGLPEESLKTLNGNSLDNLFAHTEAPDPIEINFEKPKEQESENPGQNPGQQQRQEAPQAEQNMKAGDLITPEMATELLDILAVTGLQILANMAKIKVTKSELKASSQEKELIKPVLGKALDSMNITFDNPWSALGVVLLSVYGAKAGALYMERKQEKKTSQEGEAPAIERFTLGSPKKGRGRPRKQ